MVGLLLTCPYKCKTVQTLVGRGGNEGKAEINRCIGHSEIVLLFHPPTIVKVVEMVGLSFRTRIAAKNAKPFKPLCGRGGNSEINKCIGTARKCCYSTLQL